MNFWRDNFKDDSGKWTDYNTGGGTIEFSGGGKTFSKTTPSWDTLGQVIIEKRALQAGDEITLLFEPVTNTPGTPADSGASFIECSLRLDQPTFSHSNYGLYIQGDKFYALNHDPIDPGVGSIVAGKRYTVTYEIDPDSGMSVWIDGHAMQRTRLASFPGPFIGRDAYFLVNIYSADTFRVLDFKGSD